ncbi:DUF4174 domain-containing protein [Puniceicoccus vermicola]|uniref:DUF4174 domain-containing protein n=1 Tax=Puniceicoccus vermicola TaxID=388746 RepID=A0A7X1AYZ5_9BACT|nr:DUF4174 domain-containing protein [Puniceicoccus vermicola]MBC2601528.1 DUF4174 domain-containing protein [Puniceicoccus vermicola]
MSFADSSPLKSYEWKNRIIVYRLPDKELPDLEKTIKADEEGIRDRDLIFLRLGTRPDIPSHHELSPEAIQELTERFHLDIDSPQPVFLLIGKDGGEKDRQTEDFDLREWFDRIDSMPMRQQEMR